jgi:hypothetical protein
MKVLSNSVAMDVFAVGCGTLGFRQRMGFRKFAVGT